jgi:predicted nucleic acid-binding protein
MIYLDTAALVDWLNTHSDRPLVSSAIAEVELPRALRRTEPELLAAVPAVLARIAVYEIDDLVRTTAAAYPDELIRSLGAIHLATADAVLGGDLTAFVTYDRRLLASADAPGLPTARPGEQ